MFEVPILPSPIPFPSLFPFPAVSLFPFLFLFLEFHHEKKEHDGSQICHERFLKGRGGGGEEGF